MKFFPHNLLDNERCYVSVRMTSTEHQTLRGWMKTHPEQPCVSFVHGVRLERRTMGWYRLNPSNTFRAAEKIKTAFALLRKFAHEYERKLAEEARRRNILNAERTKRDVDPTPQHRVPASMNRLQQLQQHFRS